MKKWCFVSVLALCSLLATAAPAGQDSAEHSDTSLKTGFALTRQVLLTNPSDANAQNAYNMAFLAQFYASRAEKHNDQGAGGAAYAFGILAAQYSYNAFLTTGNAVALTAFAFCYVGAIEGLNFAIQGN